MTLQYHVINRSSNFVKRDSSLYIPTLPKLIAIDIVLMNITILTGHVIVQDHIIIESRDSMGRSYSRYVIILPSFENIDIVVGEICFYFVTSSRRIT